MAGRMFNLICGCTLIVTEILFVHKVAKYLLATKSIGFKMRYYTSFY